jgi:DNA-binding NarL/FixJ family response regulator
MVLRVESCDKISVLVIDDNALNRFGLRTALGTKKGISLIAETDSGEKGVDLSREMNPNIVIIGPELPGIDPLETIEQIKSINRDIKIVVLTSNKEESDVLDILCAGAQAYCLKDITPEKLWHVVDFIRDGAIWFDAGVAPYIVNTLVNRRNNRKYRPFTHEMQGENQDNIQLTQRELDVLGLIVDGYTNPEISRKLCVSIHTAKAHVANILHKLSVDDRTQAAIKALKYRII